MDEPKEFARQWLSVVLATLMVVAFTAFTTIPYQLARHPGDPVSTMPVGSGHMT